MYEYLKKYQVKSEEVESNEKYIFYPIDDNEIKKAEKKLKIKFPYEMELFFREIGYGFFEGEQDFVNLIMPPLLIVDFQLGIGEFEGYDKDDYIDEDECAIMDLGSDSYICLKVKGKLKGKICYGLKVIANSFDEVVQKLDDEPNYYMEYK